MFVWFFLSTKNHSPYILKLNNTEPSRHFCVIGLMCEILWSDPQPNPGRGPSKRGVGLAFGADVTKRFLEENNLGNCFLVMYLFCSVENNCLMT